MTTSDGAGGNGQQVMGAVESDILKDNANMLLLQKNYSAAQRVWADVVYGVAAVVDFRDETGPEDKQRRLVITIGGDRSMAADFDAALKANGAHIEALKRGEEVDPIAYFSKRSILLQLGNKTVEMLLAQREVPVKDLLKPMAEAAKGTWEGAWEGVKAEGAGEPQTVVAPPAQKKE